MNGKTSLVLAILVALAASAVVLNAYDPGNKIVSDDEAAARARPKRNFLKSRVLQIKNACIDEIIISRDDVENIFQRFLDNHPHLIPRHMRDMPRLISMIKSHALLNVGNRERIEGTNLLVATQIDIDEGFRLYSTVSKPNELGMPPEVYRFYEQVFIPLADEPKLYTPRGVSKQSTFRNSQDETTFDTTGLLTRKELSTGYYRVFRRTIGKKRLQNIINMLLEVGLIQEDTHPHDKRVTVYSHVPGYIVSEKKNEV